MHRLLAFLPLAWLLPNHTPPWISAWAEGTAIAVCAAAGLGAAAQQGFGRISTLWLAFSLVAAASVLLQWLTGIILFGGDAIMVLFYLGAFVCALGLGGLREDESVGSEVRRWQVAELMGLSTLLAAISSLGLALMQWTGVGMPNLWVVDLPPAGRPFANVAQPNHLCSILFLGLCSAGYLCERRRIGTLSKRLAQFVLLFGMTMTGSRTGWVQVGALCLGLWMLGRSTLGSSSLREIFSILGAFALFTAVWPQINQFTILEAGRSVIVQIDGGVRLTLWGQLINSLALHPWLGFGWQQMTVAQLQIPADMFPLHRHFEHSHNFFLDLLVWAGLPTGLLLVALALIWLVSRLMLCRDRGTAWVLAMVFGLVIHGMLEYPLEYAYFLIPLAFWMGHLDRSCSFVSTLRIGRAVAFLISGALTAGIVIVARDYLRAEASLREIRFEAAGIGIQQSRSALPQMIVLNQLGSYLRFARTEAVRGMTPDQLNQMRRVKDRYAYPPVMFRYALALALNRQPAAAASVLTSLCAIHRTERCGEAREAWLNLTSQYPELALVRVP